MKNLVCDNHYDWNSEFDALNEEQKLENNSILLCPNNSEEKEIKISNNSSKEKNKSVSNSIYFKTFSIFFPKTHSKQFIEKKKIEKIFLVRKRNRKEMTDNILKKIKSRFFKSLRKAMINLLKKEKENKKEKKKEKTFKFNKHFIEDVVLSKNRSYWDEHLYDFANEKLEGNKDTIIKYLEKNKIGKMTLRDIYNEYLLSQEYEDNLPDENQAYINKYKNKSKDFINYFTNNPKYKDKKFLNLEINNIIENPPFYVKNYFIDTFPLIDNDDENNSSLSNVFSSEPNLNIFQES